VSARGQTDAPYDRVEHSIELRAAASSSQSAQKTLEPAAAKLRQTTEAWRGAGKILSVRFHSSIFSSSQSQKHVYVATFGATMITSRVAEVLQMQQLLAAFDGATLWEPRYHFADPEPLREAALADAWKRVRRRLGSQCATLGIDPASLEISGWRANYADQAPPHRKVAALEGGGGQARVTVFLDVHFDRRARAE